MVAIVSLVDAAKKMASIRANKTVVDISTLKFDEPLFRLADLFFNTNGRSTGPRYNLEFNHNGKWIPTRQITFLAQDLTFRIKPSVGKFGKRYAAYFSENMDGTAGYFFKLMDSLQKLIETPEIDEKVRSELGIGPKPVVNPKAKFAPKDPLHGPVFTGEKQDDSPPMRITSLDFRPAGEGNKGTEFVTTQQEIAEILGMKWVRAGARSYGLSGPEIFDVYLDPARADERPTLITATRFVVNELARTNTGGASFRIYTNSVVIRGIATKTETVNELLDFEEGGIPSTPLTVASVRSCTPPTAREELAQTQSSDACDNTCSDACDNTCSDACDNACDSDGELATATSAATTLPPAPSAAVKSAAKFPAVKSYGLAK